MSVTLSDNGGTANGGVDTTAAQTFAITVNAVAPGFIATDMTEVLPEAQKTALMAQIPLGRLGQVEEIAAMVRLLVGPEGTFITGQTIHVNGGEFLT